MTMEYENNVYIGVVEDRNDPMEMGRVRVRIYGLHSPDRKTEVPIDEMDSRPGLPWCHVVHPVTHSTTSGNIPQLVEGTWVVVMFLDQNYQDPLILGSLTSSVSSQKPNYEEGFSDPFGVYPKWIKGEGESEVSLIGRESTWKEHPTYIKRAETRVVQVPTAKAYPTDSISSRSSSAYERDHWDEKTVRDGQDSKYPYNAIREFENGSTEEHDSTPDGNHRITKMHPSGTYEEIVHDGSRTLKIVSDHYEIVLQDKMMYVKGNLDVTVEGNKRELIKGDYTLEVGGNLHTTVGGHRVSKIKGSDALEVTSNSATNITGFHTLRCGESQTILVKKTILIDADGNITIDGGPNIYLNP